MRQIKNRLTRHLKYIQRTHNFFLGTEPITINGDDITVGDKTYAGTAGLWKLLTLSRPNKIIYNSEDIENYAEILNNTNATKNPNNPSKPKSSRSEKYLSIIEPIWENRPYKGDIIQLTPKPKRGPQGSGVKTVILPSDPDALIERWGLLFAGLKAGDTGVINELVSISNELLRQGIINVELYKTTITQIKYFKL